MNQDRKFLTRILQSAIDENFIYGSDGSYKETFLDQFPTVDPIVSISYNPDLDIVAKSDFNTLRNIIYPKKDFNLEFGDGAFSGIFREIDDFTSLIAHNQAYLLRQLSAASPKQRAEYVLGTNNTRDAFHLKALLNQSNQAQILGLQLSDWHKDSIEQRIDDFSEEFNIKRPSKGGDFKVYQKKPVRAYISVVR